MAGQPTSDAHRGHRWSAPLAIAVGLAYVLWRSFDTLTGVAPWLAITALVLEVAGLAGTTALLAALRRTSRSPELTATDGEQTDGEPIDAELGPIDVVVRFDGQSVGNLHATLAGVRHMFDVQRVVVVTERVEEATKAVRGTAVAVIEADPLDQTRLRLAAQIGGAPFLAMFDAGDVPQPGFTGVVRSAFVDGSVGVSQGCLVPDGVDSAERDARGRHELRFEREVLNPALGARGGAVFLGSGAIVRRSVLQTVTVPRGARRSAELRWSIRVRAAGHALVAPPRPIVSAVSINVERAVSAERRRVARAALATLVSGQDPVWNPRLRGTHRVGYLAWMVRPLSGLRRVVFVGVVVACVINSESPVRPQSSVWVMTGLFAGWFLLQGLAIERCSEGRLRAGDRSRWSLRTMGASTAALFGAGRGPVGESFEAARPGGWRGARGNPFLVLGLLSLASASVAIGVDRWRQFLPEPASAGNPAWTRGVAAAVAVWTIALMLDVMRCLVGGPQLRAVQRLRVRLDATVDGVPARLTNLSPSGAGVLFEHELDVIVGDQMTVRFLVPAGSGTTAEVATIGTVRAIRFDAKGSEPGLVCGVEFGTMDRISADALFAYCALVQPDRTTDPELVAGPVSQQRFVGVRLLGATALLGIGAAMMPPYGQTAAADLPTTQTITVHLTDRRHGTGIEGAHVIATCVEELSVVDDRDEVLDLARAAMQLTRTQQRARVSGAGAPPPDRNLRRENVPSKQATQQARWDEQNNAGVDSVADVIGVGGDPASVGWHRVPSVKTTEAEPIVASDDGNGDYVLSGLTGSPCRVEVVELPTAYAPAPLSARNRGLVQFVEVGAGVLMMADPVTDPTASPIEIGNRVWFDVDGDGLQDPSEPGLPGVPVTLTIDGTVDGDEHRVLTDRDGAYRFSNDPTGPTDVGVESSIAALHVGSTVQIQVPVTVQRGSSSFHLTVAGATTAASLGPSSTIDSSVDPATGTFAWTIGAQAGIDHGIDHGIDIGYAQTHMLGDRVWLDADNDGLLGPGEQGIDGVTVLLYTDAGGDGLPDGDPVDAQITSRGGLYAFGGLPAGKYVVEVHPPDGMVSSTGAIGRVDGPYEPNAIGLVPTRANDDDDDGVMMESGVIRSSTVTLGDTPSPSGEINVPDTSVGEALAAVPDEWADATIDFGLFPTRAIDDAVWLDEDGNGRLSSDEPGVAGVPLVLLRGDEVLAQTVSDAQGDFVFPNVTLGDYTIQIFAAAGLRSVGTLPPLNDDGELPQLDDEPANTTATSDTSGATSDSTVLTEPAVTEPTATEPTATDPATGEATELPIIPATAPMPAEDPAFEVVQVSVAPDWAGPDSARALQRFGLWAPRSIGHMVWEDADDDGVIDDSEVGIPGVSVRLLEGDRVVARTLSAVDGTYRFIDLPDGTYRVAVDVPDTWRTSSVAWDDASVPNADIDQGVAANGTGRVVSSPIDIGKTEVDAIGSFEHANVGLFQPRPSVTLSASLRGCAAESSTGSTGPLGTCIGSASVDDNPVIAAGSTATWSYLVTNTGNVPLSALTVTTDLASTDLGATGVIDCNGSRDGDGQPLLLEVGRSVTCTASDVISAGQGSRTATVKASAESSPGNVGDLEPVDDTTKWFGTPPSLALRTFVTLTSPGADTDGDGVLDAGPVPHLGAVDDADRPGGSDADANHVVADGTPVWWVYEVVNSSGAPLADVSVVDQQRGRVCDDVTLAAGEHRFCVASGALTRIGSDHGQLRFLATATATAAFVIPGTGVSDPMVRVSVGPVSDAAHAYVAQPALELSVAVNGQAAGVTPINIDAGDSLDVSYTVTNSGDVAFGTVELTSALTGADASPIDCPELSLGRGGLEPGESVMCTVRQRPDVPAPVSGASVPLEPTQTFVRAEGKPLVEGSTADAVIAETSWLYAQSTAEVAGQAFLDVDGDAALGSGDAPMPGVEVRLLDDQQQQTIATATTDADGHWRFSSLAPGRYSVEYVVPEGYLVAAVTTTGMKILEPDGDNRTFVTDQASTDASIDAPIDPAIDPDTPAQPSWQLALIRPTSLGDEVWFDTNDDGRHDADERGAVHAEVTLTDTTGRTVARTTTNEQGRWILDGLVPAQYVLGQYEVTIETPRGPVTTDGARSVGIGSVASLEDRVWDDVDGDGWLSTGETGMGRVVVTLVDASAGFAKPVAVTSTDNIGRYAFAEVPPGDYMIVLGAVAEGVPTDSLMVSLMVPGLAPPPTPTPSPVSSLVPAAPAVRAGGSAAAIVVTHSSTVDTDLSLAVSPDTMARVAPGRMVTEAPSLLDPSDLIPTSPAEVVQAMVFVVSLVVFSLVVATARRRRLR